jgi:hypothetical protein
MKPSLSELLLFAGTRVALGIGIGFLVSGKLNRDQRRAAGLALTIVGGASTIPFALGFRQLRNEGERLAMRSAA